MNISHSMTMRQISPRSLVIAVCISSLFSAVRAKESEDIAPVPDGPFVSNVDPANSLISSAKDASDEPEDWKPRQKKSHVGLSVGNARFNMPCVEGMECRRNGRAITLYAGGEFSKRWGFELAYMRMSNMEHAGNAVRVRGLNLNLVGEVPLASRLQLTGRLGTNFAKTDMDQAINSTQPAGSASGFGLSYGTGMNWNVSENWTASADWNCHDFKFVTGRSKVDTTTVSLRYHY